MAMQNPLVSAGVAPSALAPARSGASQQSPNEIGWLFVPQYYTFVNKDPSRLHCFYTKRSTFVHGTEGEECTPRHGQQEIHEKILSLGFENCKVYVSNVDSQSSAEGGIIVQVLGEMSNRGGEWRKFAQTFFLAEQPNGYFVLNDIFRYIKEEGEEREDVGGGPASPALIESVSAAMAPPPTSYGSISTSAPSAAALPPSLATLGHPPPHTPSSTATGLSLEPVSHDQSSAPHPQRQPQVNGWHHETESLPAMPTPASSERRTPSPLPSPAVSAPPIPPADAPVAQPSTSSGPASSEPPPPQPVPDDQVVPTPAVSTSAVATPPAAASVETPVSVAPSSDAAVTPAVTTTTATTTAATPAAAPPAPVKKTWANLAASGGAWKAGPPQAVKPASQTVPAVVSNAPTPPPSTPQPPLQPAASTSQPPPPQPPPPQQQQQQQQQHHQQQQQQQQPPPPQLTASGRVIPNVNLINHPHCFVKNVQEQVTDDGLYRVLEDNFGPIKVLEIVRTKACAFLEFKTVESARKAIKFCSPHSVGGHGGIECDGMFLHIEEKKPKGDASRPSGGIRGGRGLPMTGQGRGGPRMMPVAPPPTGPAGAGRGGSAIRGK